MRVLLITPPMVQVNAPYAATPALAGALKAAGHDVAQLDASLELALALFSSAGVRRIRAEVRGRRGPLTPSLRHSRRHAGRYEAAVDPVIRFLQGRDPSLALRLAGRGFLPEGPRFAAVAADVDEAFGSLGTHDLAVYRGSLFLDDLADVIRDGVDGRFELARYAESLAASAPTFDPLARALRRPPSLVDRQIDALADAAFERHAPEAVGLTVPFPGTVYGALRLARRLKALRPGLPVIWGGGYVNTELRGLTDTRLFDHVDYLVLDDGELPLLRILDRLAGGKAPLIRTLVRQGRRVVRSGGDGEAGLPPEASATPEFAGLPLDRYFVMAEMLNPMHRVWSSARWNKLMLAHGCYWHRCRFCDTELDYIRRFRATPATVLADRIEQVIAQTGQTGFHFIDEAAPPAVLRQLAEEILRRRLAITWWGNIRFEAAFTPGLARTLARSGCVAVTGGLEAADDRLLGVLGKGIRVADAARATHALAGAGIMVHAYLMYGCPTQTEQDTVNALETVRRLFAGGALHSVYWHRFALTVHSAFYRQAAAFGLRLPRRRKPAFACNEVPFVDTTGVDHAMLGRGLRKAAYNYMHGVGLDTDVRTWFDRPVPPPALC